MRSGCGDIGLIDGIGKMSCVVGETEDEFEDHVEHQEDGQEDFEEDDGDVLVVCAFEVGGAGILSGTVELFHVQREGDQERGAGEEEEECEAVVDDTRAERNEVQQNGEDDSSTDCHSEAGVLDGPSLLEVGVSADSIDFVLVLDVLGIDEHDGPDKGENNHGDDEEEEEDDHSLGGVAHDTLSRFDGSNDEADCTEDGKDTQSEVSGSGSVGDVADVEWAVERGDVDISEFSPSASDCVIDITSIESERDD